MHCLLDHLDRRLVVDREAQVFAESSFGLTGEELANALKDAEADETAILLALVFSPNQQLRHAVERFVCTAPLHDNDVSELVERVLASRRTVPLHIEGNVEPLSIPLDRHLVAGMIGRLGLDRCLDDEVCSVMEQLLPENQLLAARAALRAAGLVMTERTRPFLCTFVHRASRNQEEFSDMFARVLTLIAEVPADIAVETYLFAKREQLLKTLQAIERYHEKREQHGFEYLLMNRYPIPHESAESVQEQLQTLERLIFGVLRLQPPPARQIHHRDLGSYDDKDLERLWRDLS